MGVWCNGRRVDGVSISHMDRGFTLGDGAFCTLCYDNGQVEFFSQHMTRLRGTLDILGISIPYTDTDILNGIMESIGDTPHVIRITVSRGAGGRGLQYPDTQNPTVLITVNPITRERPPASLTLTDVCTRNETDMLCNHKTLGYTSFIVAYNQAIQNGYDDCLIPNTRGDICCTSIANIFAIKGDILYTPALSSGCLNGIYRKYVLDTAHALTIPVCYDTIQASDMCHMDSVFMTNSITGIRLVQSLDGHMYDLQNPIAHILSHTIKIKESE